MHFTFRPLASWPYEDTARRRSRATFKAGWDNTRRLLVAELHHLDASNAIIGAGFREQDLRLDGLPRSDARAPAHPGVEVSFDTERHGRLTYVTDCCAWWEHNIRSVALGLESLRAVDRYGITQRGEQYAGWRALPSGDGPNATRGGSLVRDVYGGNLRAALQHTHPDGGGDAKDFADVQAYREQRGLSPAGA